VKVQAYTSSRQVTPRACAFLWMGHESKDGRIGIGIGNGTG
jgi:hypothetical protein